MVAVERIIEAVSRCEKAEFALTDPELAELREGLGFLRGISSEQVRILPVLRDCLRAQLAEAEVDVVRRARGKKQISCISIRDRRREGRTARCKYQLVIDSNLTNIIQLFISCSPSGQQLRLGCG